MQTITVGEREIREAVTMDEAIETVRRGFVDLAGGEFEMPTRTALRDGQFLVMSAHHRSTASAMFNPWKTSKCISRVAGTMWG